MWEKVSFFKMNLMTGCWCSGSPCSPGRWRPLGTFWWVRQHEFCFWISCYTKLKVFRRGHQGFGRKGPKGPTLVYKHSPVDNLVNTRRAWPVSKSCFSSKMLFLRLLVSHCVTRMAFRSCQMRVGLSWTRNTEMSQDSAHFLLAFSLKHVRTS